SRRARAPTPRGSVFHHESRGLVRGECGPLSAPISRRQRTDLPQQRPRPARMARLAPQGKTKNPPRHLGGSGGAGRGGGGGGHGLSRGRRPRIAARTSEKFASAPRWAKTLDRRPSSRHARSCASRYATPSKEYTVTQERIRELTKGVLRKKLYVVL